MPGPDFLDLPVRATKPRGAGITHVLDRGLPLAHAADLLAMAGAYVDVWKLGWGISYLDPTPADVHPADALNLETLRLSLRADTYGAWSPGSLPVHGT